MFPITKLSHGNPYKKITYKELSIRSSCIITLPQRPSPIFSHNVPYLYVMTHHTKTATS